MSAFSFATVYLLLVLSMGFFVSTITKTQQQAMFIAWFFMMLFLLMSGLFTPFESMPIWAQKLMLLILLHILCGLSEWYY